ncbi:MAG TPA: hypothetical protein PKL30_05965 [Leptospiraceae bacterium]|nr:hypothetical protein [Leptospiraceae bacterium]HMX30632.1 hypothetical protein [Leptospiraceae bacterium]HMY31332.1 hypothetical protein [Leptospiraceae bacterium]HNA08421.1 hypothetical protein [Leptospiraceae bacterium]HNG99541.1 hypothetical protein [Leptospiraceae bacterium]
MKTNKFLIRLCQVTLISFLIFHFIQCNDPNAEERKKRNDDNKTALLELIGLSWGSKEIGAVVDNKDGTLNYTYQLLQTNSWLGNKVISQKTILIRRCLIGQVYRSAPNDCQGTGTKDTVWGASQLQWCPTNDRSCEKDGKADPAISPAAKACATDTFAGKKWKLPSKDDSLGTLLSELSGGFYNTGSNYIAVTWLMESISENKALYARALYNFRDSDKNSAGEVLCKEDI